MYHKLVCGLIACVACVMIGCVSKPAGFIPLSTVVKPPHKVEPLQPRAVEAWTDPAQQEISRRLMTLDEHRETLDALLKDLWKIQMPAQLSNSESIIAELTRNIELVSWYPPIAHQNKWAGRVVIDVLVRDNGDFITGCIAKSSGHAVLDYTAYETVRQAFPLHLKEPLEYPLMRISVPIHYRLEPRGKDFFGRF